ncbi:hypothetical protein [Nocardia sp. NPDC057440]|uniref:hypothetical protein n=1 Tax=Nocardia sp. NPDC057440 TaxID=3346134 RepID=UPI00366C2D39
MSEQQLAYVALSKLVSGITKTMLRIIRKIPATAWDPRLHLMERVFQALVGRALIDNGAAQA